MQFPKFNNFFRCHMPFCNQCNNQIVYMVCMSIKNGIWKIYYYQNNEWKRLTNYDDKVIQCNPSVYYKNNQYYVSFVSLNNQKQYVLQCFKGNSLSELQKYYETNTFSGFLLNDVVYKSVFNNIIQIDDGTTKKRIKIKKCDKIQRLTYNPQNENQLIVTYIYQNTSYVCSIINQSIKQIVSKNNSILYKTFRYGDQYWNVQKIYNFDYQCLRIINKTQCELIDIDNEITIQVVK